MKKMLTLMAVVLSLGLMVGVGDAEAKRLGGGKPLGMQRQMNVPKSPAAAPAPAAPTAAAAAKPAPAAAAQSAGARSWMAPLAGLAAGLGLAALASHFGFGEELASLMLMLLIGLAVLAVVGFVMRKRALAAQPALAGNAGGRLHADPEALPASRFEATTPVSGAGAAAVGAGRIPADFDVAGFVRNAKVHFIRLQAANDAGNLDDLREFTTPEMFAELKMDIAERGGAQQETDVVDIDAEVLEVVEEDNRYVASVRFVGHIREQKNGPVEAVDEVWHLVKPRDGSSGWRLAGIQQIS